MAVPNVYLLEDGKTYDASILIDSKGEITGIPKMVHVAQAPQFYEQSYYTSSNEGFKVFNTEYGNMNFSGESLAVDANGGILAKADYTEQLMYIEIDVKKISHIRAGKNYTQLRRKELYK